MGTHLLLHASIFLVAVTFFMKDALALECHSCVDLGDGGCNAENMKKVECPASTHVCVETVAAVEWSHGKFSVGEKGCGLGMPGTNDKAVDVHGILAFSQLHQCNSSHCNTKLDIKNLELEPIGNESARVANGVECYSCYGNECSLDNSTTVKCYDSFRGCFHGNVTMKAGNFSLTRPLKGCVQDEDCTKVMKGSPAITVMGSCCSGSLCNVDLSNKTYFAPKIPRLAVMPGQGTNATVAATTAATTATTSTRTRNTAPAPSTVGKPIRSVAVSPSSSSRDDHDHNHDHNHDHDNDFNNDNDHDHDHDDDHSESPVRNGNRDTAVKVEGRQSQHPTSGDAAGLGGSILLSLLLAGLLL